MEKNELVGTYPGNVNLVEGDVVSSYKIAENCSVIVFTEKEGDEVTGFRVLTEAGERQGSYLKFVTVCANMTDKMFDLEREERNHVLDEVGITEVENIGGSCAAGSTIFHTGMTGDVLFFDAQVQL